MGNNFENKDFNDFIQLIRSDDGEKWREIFNDTDEASDDIRAKLPQDALYLGSEISTRAIFIALGLLREYHRWLTSPSEHSQP